ncbi:CLUMA_CG004338, isoform A [Clunio marinus]|uniref:CLUMA_CG004338, isoform A n=1 Tax=Clunio marinus TaxID=568069 RepID=A0A1J1HTC8_9DIPT|nr:CLUMA_CG004338, isoform A [Clunio marinus]
MGGVFGKSKKSASRVTEQDKAVLQLKQQRDKIKQYQKRIEQSLENDRELARQCLNKGQRERAKLILRKKKYQENLLATTDKELEALEKLTTDLEFAQVQQQVVDGLQVGNEALKKIHEILTIDEVERIMDETREGIEKQQEIDAIISTGALSQEDEDSVAAELEELVASTLPAIDEDFDDKLPDVPVGEPIGEEKKKKKKEIEPERRVALEA